MNSEEQTAPPPGVAVVTTPEGANTQEPHAGKRRRRRRNRRRHRRREHRRDRTPPTTTQVTTTTEEDRPAVTEGTQLHQARQNHSTYDRDLHHRGRGGTGYGYRRDVTQPESELWGHQLPAAILPSYEQVLKRAGITQVTVTPEEPQDD